MRRIFPLLLLLLIVVIGVGFLVLGAFPPDPRSQPIQKILPNDRFRGG